MIAKEWRDARWKLLIALAAILVIVFVVPRTYEQIQADTRREIEQLQRQIESPDAALLDPDLPPEMREQELSNVDEYRAGMRGQIEDMRRPEWLPLMAKAEITGFSMGANVVLVPLAGLLGVALISGEVGRGTIFLLLSRPVSRRRTLLTKYAVCAGVLFAAAVVGAIASIISGYAHGYPAGSFSAVEILASAGLFWLGTLFVLGVALLASVLFGDVIKSVIAAVASLYVIHSAPDFARSFIQWLTWTDEDYERSFGPMDAWYQAFERFRLINYWTAPDIRTGEFALSLAAQNSLVCLVAAAVPLLLALWWFRRKAY
jgi:ABC-type transport system involved in multi-copper enzyme maturation permease subunit